MLLDATRTRAKLACADGIGRGYPFRRGALATVRALRALRAPRRAGAGRQSDHVGTMGVVLVLDERKRGGVAAQPGTPPSPLCVGACWGRPILRPWPGLPLLMPAGPAPPPRSGRMRPHCLRMRTARASRWGRRCRSAPRASVAPLREALDSSARQWTRTRGRSALSGESTSGAAQSAATSNKARRVWFADRNPIHSGRVSRQSVTVSTFT